MSPYVEEKERALAFLFSSFGRSFKVIVLYIRYGITPANLWIKKSFIGKVVLNKN